ncbi:phosphoribosylglycinamide formyltransferase [Phocaeicola abscessus]|uniref:phosphoribosylglycinamide formyltransferase n=1 Tax=Phocaeicola abscessus TaxID=555313 RepID=UPI000386C605|nr:phosphoribosylglycinamide formyltransferase [Phocaeicola abscessus]EPT33398.1 putative phosphoribosylglycinamide formyltransferase [Bacteroidetes bacterium oral taxon 272 str. F0290]
MIKIAILASGEGTNAENMIRYFQKKKTAEVIAVFANKRHVGVYRRVEPLGVQVQYVPNADFSDGKALRMLQERKVDFIVLAGFLFKIPDDILVAYPDRIVNVHPALLPKHGGKGMYGNKVHAAVIADGDLESGITIHYIDGNYDEGKTLFQAKCPVLPDDTPETLAQRVHQLEHTYYPQVVEAVVLGKPLDKLTL